MAGPNVYVRTVKSGGPAAEAGLEQYDRLLEINGADVRKSSQAEVVALLKRAPEGSSISMLVARDPMARLQLASATDSPKPERRPAWGAEATAAVPASAAAAAEATPAPEPRRMSVEEAAALQGMCGNCLRVRATVTCKDCALDYCQVGTPA